MDIESVSANIIDLSTRHVWEYWCDKRSSSVAPTWRDFELLDLFREAPSFQVCDVSMNGDEFDFVYRFVGTEIVNSRARMAKPDFTGMHHKDVEYQYDFTVIYGAMCEAAGNCTPFHFIQNFDARDARGIQERLIMPLIDEDGQIDKLAVYRCRLESDQKYLFELNK